LLLPVGMPLDTVPETIDEGVSPTSMLQEAVF
jgi:hypothetical protein